MSEQLTSHALFSSKIPERYKNVQIIGHLASQYVLGTLTRHVHQCVEKQAVYNEALAQRIEYWQTRFVPLDQQTKELPPSEQVWQNIANAIEITEKSKAVATKIEPDSSNEAGLIHFFSSSLKSWLTIPATRYVSVFSFAILAVLVLLISKPFEQNNDPLSYVAVLTEPDGKAHLVATTYGESKKLIVNVVGTPMIGDHQSLELWVVSKSDSEARSLGVISTGKKLIEQQLTNAQWRLIKDSESLIVTIEEVGGSAIGEPSSLIVSRGLCVRLQEWENDV
ncbi:MAG: anti-sigma factor [Colwellia sp.]|nr:anti-sigma factor [Colwellia sp.]